MNLRDVLELSALLVFIAVVALATGMVWPPLLAAGLSLAYLSHAWSWGDEPDEADTLRAGLQRIIDAARRSQVTKAGVLDTIEAAIAVPEADASADSQ